MLNFCRCALVSQLFLASASLVFGASAGTNKITETRLENGFEVLVYSEAKVPLVTLVLVFKAGAMTETADIDGLTHFWEHMFFKGNQKYKDQESFQKRIRELGIVFNGDTSAEKVRYFFTLPSSKFEEGVEFMADAIRTPKLEVTELERESAVVMNEYERNASQPGFGLYRLSNRILYGDKALKRDALGSAEIIKTANQAKLYRIRDEVFVPQNGALVVSGDVGEDLAVKTVGKYFSSWKNPPNWKLPDTTTEFLLKTKIEAIYTHPQAQNIVMEMSYQGPTTVSSKEHTFSVDILAFLLEHSNGKFYRKFVDSGLALDAGLSMVTTSVASEVNISAMVMPENFKKLKAELVSEVGKWSDPLYFTESELADVKRKMRIAHIRELNKPSEFGKSLAFWWAVAGLDYYNSYLDALDRVTLADVGVVVKKYLSGPYLTSILSSPADAKKVGLKPNYQELEKKYGLYR